MGTWANFEGPLAGGYVERRGALVVVLIIGFAARGEEDVCDFRPVNFVFVGKGMEDVGVG